MDLQSEIYILPTFCFKSKFYALHTIYVDSKKVLVLENAQDKKNDKQPLFRNILSRLIALLAYLAVSFLGCWLGYLIYKWLINKLFLWSPRVTLIVTAISLIWCIVAIILYQLYTKIFLYKDIAVQNNLKCKYCL